MLYDLISHIVYMRICLVLPLHILNIAGTVTNASGLNDICSILVNYVKKKHELFRKKKRDHLCVCRATAIPT